jgi:hypothetical protein
MSNEHRLHKEIDYNGITIICNLPYIILYKNVGFSREAVYTKSGHKQW